MAEIDSNITRLYEWDNKRKEKIKKMQKEKSNEIEKNKHIPRINKKSKNMVNRNRIKNKKENIFIRLSKEDDFVVEKKRILAELLSPTFKPNINLTFRRFDDDVFEEKKKRNQKFKKSNLNNKDNKEDFIRITVNRNNNIKPKTIKTNVENIIEKENEKLENDEVSNIFRKIIINNMNNKIRNKSA